MLSSAALVRTALRQPVTANVLLPGAPRFSTGVDSSVQSGIGTNEPLLSLNGIMTVLPRLVDEAIAYTMADHVVNGYAFLMEHYRPGDRIFLFGSSFSN